MAVELASALARKAREGKFDHHPHHSASTIQRDGAHKALHAAFELDQE